MKTFGTEQDSRILETGFKTQLCSFPSVSSWTGDLNFLSFGVLIFPTGVILFFGFCCFGVLCWNMVPFATG